MDHEIRLYCFAQSMFGFLNTSMLNTRRFSPPVDFQFWIMYVYFYIYKHILTYIFKAQTIFIYLSLPYEVCARTECDEEERITKRSYISILLYVNGKRVVFHHFYLICTIHIASRNSHDFIAFWHSFD